MTWINSGHDRDSTISALPEISAKFDQLYSSFWKQPYIAFETLELCRLRLAQLHSSAVDLQREEYAVVAQKREALAQWNTDTQFSDAERACLELTEIYAMDAQAISDEQAEAVKKHYGDAGLLVLIQALGVFDSMTRLSLLWQLSPVSSAS